ncbi:hypothetical protein BU15DRAFT_90780 [Melanogaster broomeanus]|nr:hypothetical protein BU15DRAFT_90780 [Melanogaster broomeanus]
MPQCPNCLKTFATDTGVTRHLSQPLTSCRAWQDDLVAIADVFTRDQRSMSPNLEHSDVFEDPTNNDLQAGVDAANLEQLMHSVIGDSHSHADQDEPMEVDEPNYEPETQLGVQDGGVGVVEPPATVEYYPGAAKVFALGETFLDHFQSDQYSTQRKINAYYPFASAADWDIAKFLLRSPMSMAQIDEFLKIELIRGLPLSFCTAKELRGRAELLPSGPRWNVRVMDTSHPTKSPVRLYFRDTLDCIESLFNHPYFIDKLDLTPQRIFETAEHVVRMYSEWMTSDVAWSMQSQLPLGATLLGVILSSDKTNITAMTGGRVAHPLLISLANIKMDVRNKASNNAFLLAALLPIPEFIHPVSRICSVLSDRLIHRCLDIVLEPLKQAAQLGRMMSDPAGDLRLCYTPLAAYIVDTPEAAMLACVRGLTSPVTMAMYKNFGDPLRHLPRLGSVTLAQLATIKADISDVDAYFAQCEEYRLSGVALPFWRDWALSDPSRFLTPEALHHWFRMFFDHDLKWCLRIVGHEELDFRFAILRPVVGHRHFGTGVSKLKQVTGRAQRDMQRYIVTLISGASGTSPAFTRAVRALTDFRYLSQAPVLTDTICQKISTALKEFHDNKHVIISLGGRRGKKDVVLDNWYIPKLELMQSVVPSVSNSGSLLQWSADTTEHAHITLIKDPGDATNNNGYDSQICRFLDRAEKCRLFDVGVHLSLAEASCVTGRGEDEIDSNSDNDDDYSVEPPEVHPASVLSDLWGSTRQPTNFFKKAYELTQRGSTAVGPSRTILSGSVAIHLNYDPSVRRISVDDAAQKFSLPDLRGALADHFHNERTSGHFHALSQQRRAPVDAQLPFQDLQLWYKVRIQQKAFHDPSLVRPAFSIIAMPPGGQYTYGRYDAAILTVESSQHWPSSSLNGHIVAEIRLIMRPIPYRGTHPIWGDRCLVYVQRLDVQAQAGGGVLEPTTQMHVLKRATRSSGIPFGGVLPLDQLRSFAHIVPKFGSSADTRLTCFNSSHFSDVFYLNKYFDKDFYYILSDSEATSST